MAGGAGEPGRREVVQQGVDGRCPAAGRPSDRAADPDEVVDAPADPDDVVDAPSDPEEVVDVPAGQFLFIVPRWRHVAGPSAPG
ncbi:hypothetical protein D5H75_15695 [Bailinhaonella thermotolerans]|uniref:Uncharacterized protein n=1 Tax=Bailinhaonella thermotolerans TaxID=1070861 RepID=A0A3A4BCH2_9ACTN|nr:hypothetical protein D5H75_15695 [Bailinhaonella thermotolerans]